ncbi:MAG: hypothetical protein ACRCYS_15355 [Beijerinckiaceae bacterium]
MATPAQSSARSTRPALPVPPRRIARRDRATVARAAVAQPRARHVQPARRFLTVRQRALLSAALACALILSVFGTIAFFLGKDGIVPRSEAMAQSANIIRK